MKYLFLLSTLFLFGCVKQPDIQPTENVFPVNYYFYCSNPPAQYKYITHKGVVEGIMTTKNFDVQTFVTNQDYGYMNTIQGNDSVSIAAVFRSETRPGNYPTIIHHNSGGYVNAFLHLYEFQ